MLKINVIISFSKRYFSEKCFKNLPFYNVDTKFELEEFWKNKLTASKEENVSTERMYVLSMFPYPSGHLHMGHMRVYTIADAIARYYKLCNKNVIFPMGWDSFGLPAENAALERDLEPKCWTEKNIEEMKMQMKNQMTLSIDWDREISTCDPRYFKWTQWIFARLFEKGFAYQKSDMVNWDPIDNTVLADELIDKEGRSWRSGALVEKKPLKQWFLRTTAFTESLLAGLGTINGDQWRHVVDAQHGWLGKLEGVYVEFDLLDRWNNGKCLEQLAVFTTMPVAVLSDLVSFVEINENNVWWKKNINAKTPQYPSVHDRLAVKHPLSGRIIPIVNNPNVKFNEEECLSARLGIPLLNINDARMAAKLNIPPSNVHLGAYNIIKNSAWTLSESHQLNEHLEDTLNEEALKTLQKLDRGGYRCSKLRTDWLISRQRYWGTPIPVIHCPDCGSVSVPDEQLPVELPPYKQCSSSQPRQDSSSPLACATDWVNVTCPKCGNSDSKRETDTMDTFVDSSWYYLRYLDRGNDTQLCAPQLAWDNMPVDIYIGGIEHAIRHLFYARFIAHFLYYHTEIKWPNGPEPFARFLPIGLMLSRTYQTKLGQFVSSDKVLNSENSKTKAVHSDTGEELVEYWDKMSKSKKNGVNPATVVDKYGLDSTRLILLANTGPDRSRKWQENDVVTGINNWEKRIWKLIKSGITNGCAEKDMFVGEDVLMNNNEFIQEYHLVLSRVIDNYETYTFSSVIALLQKLSSTLMKVANTIQCNQSMLYYRVLLDFLVLLHPLSPLLSSELWAQLSSAIVHKEAMFIDNQDRYDHICGPWTYHLNKSVWEQSLLGIKTRRIDQEKDRDTVKECVR